MKAASESTRRLGVKSNRTLQSPDASWGLGRMLNSGKMSSIFLVEGAQSLVGKLTVHDKSSKDKSVVEKELEVLSLCGSSCRFIVKLVAVQQSSTQSVLYMEHCSRGDLFKLLSHFEPSLDSIRLCLAEVAIALEFLHSKAHVIHEDLKPENIGVTKNGHIRLIDFGVSSIIQDGEMSLNSSGTVQYASPEKLMRIPHGFEADWWSFGVLAFEMLFAFLPWDGRDNTAIARRICTVPIQSYSESLGVYPGFTLVAAMLDRDPHLRFGNIEGEVLMHPFFGGLDIEKVKEGVCPPFPLQGM